MRKFGCSFICCIVVCLFDCTALNGSEKKKIALWKHCVLEHASQEADFTMEIIQCHSTCLSRQVYEAVKILRTDAEIILNLMSEFHQTPLVRVVATNGLYRKSRPQLPARAWEQQQGAPARVGVAGEGEEEEGSARRRGRRGRGD